MISAMKKRISNNKGLTLIELIIVIAIVGILAVIGITQFGGMTDGAKYSADKAMVSEIEQAAKLYVAEGGSFGVTGTTTVAPTAAQLGKYIDTTSVSFQTSSSSGKSFADVKVDKDGNVKTPQLVEASKTLTWN